MCTFKFYCVHLKPVCDTYISFPTKLVSLFVLLNSNLFSYKVFFFLYSADNENDSGYGTTNDFMPLMKLLSSNSLNKDLKMAGKLQKFCLQGQSLEKNGYFGISKL